MLSLFAIAITTSILPINYPTTLAITVPTSTPKVIAETDTVPSVPFYSQFNDVDSPKWKKQACGVVSLAMLIDYYKPDNTMSVNSLLSQAIRSGAYNQNAGWTYKGLIDLGGKYGLEGDSYDLGKSSSKAAFAKFKKYLADGPVIASIHYKFDPKSTIPHLVVINGIEGDTIYYNDPAAKSAGKQISVDNFLKGWKKRFIVIRPVDTDTKVALSLTGLV